MGEGPDPRPARGPEGRKTAVPISASKEKNFQKRKKK